MDKSLKKKLAISALGVLGLGLISIAAKANKSDSGADMREIHITDHDGVYEYLLQNGVWFTRKKGTTEWLNMKATLAESAYNKAIEVLKTYLMRKGYAQSF